MRLLVAGVVVLLLAGWSPGRALAETRERAAAERIEALEAQAVDGSGTAPAAPLTEAEAAAVDPEGTAPLEDALTCLARTIYWEAKGEELAGMEAVANVVMNRLAAEDFPETVCAVVQEGGESGPCQFSWWCDGNPDDVEEADRYELTLDVARRALNQELPDRTDGALHYHSADVAPDWAADLVETARLGAHVFYRPRPAG